MSSLDKKIEFMMKHQPEDFTSGVLDIFEKYMEKNPTIPRQVLLNDFKDMMINSGVDKGVVDHTMFYLDSDYGMKPKVSVTPRRTVGTGTNPAGYSAASLAREMEGGAGAGGVSRTRGQSSTMTSQVDPGEEKGEPPVETSEMGVQVGDAISRDMGVSNHPVPNTSTGRLNIGQRINYFNDEVNNKKDLRGNLKIPVKSGRIPRKGAYNMVKYSQLSHAIADRTLNTLDATF